MTHSGAGIGDGSQGEGWMMARTVGREYEMAHVRGGVYDMAQTRG